MDRFVVPQAAQPLPDPAEAPPPARPEVESLRAYSAPLEGRRGLLRLDFNENTMGPSPKVVEAIRAIPAELYAIYPEYDGLREAVVASLAATAGAGDASPGGQKGGAGVSALAAGAGAPGGCRPPAAGCDGRRQRILDRQTRARS